MQVGEPAGAVPASLPPDTELAVELVSITFKSPIRVSRGRKAIDPPHWERGQPPDDFAGMAKRFRLPLERFAQRAAVYAIAGGNRTCDVEVKVRVTRSHNVAGPALLSGSLRGLVIEGDCPTGAGLHTVKATITNPPDAVAIFVGPIAWGLAVDQYGIRLCLGTTAAEIYFVLGEPLKPFGEVGVWVEALRFICLRMGTVGERDAQAVTSRIAVYCHSRHGLRYESEHGAPQYRAGTHGGRFSLTAYMARKHGACNCYDQAAAIQVFAAALGIGVAWCYLSPFGFIKTTNLVGVGPCNNPFFGDDVTKKIVASDARERSGFGNHAFISSVVENAFDACAGPHVGEETLFQYISASIDDAPSLYRGRRGPGRVSDIVPGQGIVHVS